MRGVLTFLALQVGWFACVLGGARGNSWLGPLVVLALVLGHLLLLPDRTGVYRRRELLTIFGFGLVGTVADLLQSGLGLLSFHGGPASGLGAWLAPPWIAALWFHFGTVLRGPLAALRDRRRLTIALCLVGAPIAYAGGIRLGAVTFHQAWWPSVLSIGLVWAAVLSAALRLAPGAPAGGSR
jgi:hypothetical protein